MARREQSKRHGALKCCRRRGFIAVSPPSPFFQVRLDAGYDSMMQTRLLCGACLVSMSFEDLTSSFRVREGHFDTERVRWEALPPQALGLVNR